MREREPLGEAVNRGLDQPDAVTLAAHRHELQPAFFRRRDHCVAVLVIDVDHRAATVDNERLEQPELGFKIGFDARVIIQMVAAQIGEARGRDADTVEPVLIEAVRRRLHRQMRNALVGEFRQCLVQPDRIRRGQRAVDLFLRRHHTNGAETCGLVTQRRPDLPVKAATEVLPLVPVTAAITLGCFR